jgi:hypothetical protein
MTYSDNVLETVQDSLCGDCVGNGRCAREYCDDYRTELDRHQKEEDEEVSMRQHEDMKETERRFGRDIMREIGRGLR